MAAWTYAKGNLLPPAALKISLGEITARSPAGTRPWAAAEAALVAPPVGVRQPSGRGREHQDRSYLLA